MAKGAKPLIDTSLFPADKVGVGWVGSLDGFAAQSSEHAHDGSGGARRRTQPGTPYMAPQVLVNVDHTMSVMVDESFGPVIGIMKARRLRTSGITAATVLAG